MRSRLMQKELTPTRVQEIIQYMNETLPERFTHVEAGVYPFIFPKLPPRILDILPPQNPEFRMLVIKNIFSAQYSNAQLAQLFNLEVKELEEEKLKNILKNFNEQKFSQEEVDFLINRIVKKENSFEDRVAVLCDGIAVKPEVSVPQSVYEAIFKLRRFGKMDSKKADEALFDIKEIMQYCQVRFDDDCHLRDEVGKNNLLNQIEEKLQEKAFSLGLVNCRNTIIFAFALESYNGFCPAMMGRGLNGQTALRPSFGGLEKEEVKKRVSLLKDFLEFLERNKEPSPNVETSRVKSLDSLNNQMQVPSQL